MGQRGGKEIWWRDCVSLAGFFSSVLLLKYLLRWGLLLYFIQDATQLEKQ